MLQVETVGDIRELGTILSVWAHPDDESFLAAGLMATAVRNGQDVMCVTATRGEAGVQDPKRWPAETLGAVREQEMRSAMRVLGLREHVWLDYADGHLAELPDAPAVAKLAGLIKKWQPDSILTFGPDGFTGHSDHRTIGRWTVSALREAKVRARVFWPVCVPEQYDPYLKRADELFNIFFLISEPPLIAAERCAIHYRLPDYIMKLKFQALTTMRSQTETLVATVAKENLQEAWASESFIEMTGG